jgi:hypothetical protein
MRNASGGLRLGEASLGPSPQPGQLNPPGQPRSKGNPRMRFLSQGAPRNSIEFGNNLAERINRATQ